MNVVEQVTVCHEGRHDDRSRVQCARSKEWKDTLVASAAHRLQLSAQQLNKP